MQLLHILSVPSPLSVSISSDMDNPIPYGLSPTLSCTVSLPPAIDIEVEIITEWSGPTYGLREYTTTEPVLNSSAGVPTYISTAQLNAPETNYDSGNYLCSVVINPLDNSDFIRSAPSMTSPRIQGLCIYIIYVLYSCFITMMTSSCSLIFLSSSTGATQYHSKRPQLDFYFLE